MKSVLRNLAIRADAPLQGDVEDHPPFDNSVVVRDEDERIASSPRDEQLAEPKLLSRAEHDVAASSVSGYPRSNCVFAGSSRRPVIDVVTCVAMSMGDPMTYDTK